MIDWNRTSFIAQPDAAAPGWRMERAPPHRALAPFIEHYFTMHWRVEPGQHVRSLTIPSLTGKLFFYLDPILRPHVPRADPCSPYAAVVGPRTYPFRPSFVAMGRMVGVSFRPLGLGRFVRDSAAHLLDGMLPARSVIRAELDPLLAALTACATLAEQVPHLDRFLASRLLERASRPNEQRALRVLHAMSAGPAVSVAALARADGMSERHLQRLFKEAVGVAPKFAQRIARLHRTLTLLAADPHTPLARVATALGYADQAHLSNEVKLLTDFTPERLRSMRGRVGFLQANAADRASPGDVDRVGNASRPARPEEV